MFNKSVSKLNEINYYKYIFGVIVIQKIDLEDKVFYVEGKSQLKVRYV